MPEREQEDLAPACCYEQDKYKAGRTKARMSEWIDREDMLELTRRMTVSRTHFTRIAGAYLDEEGYVDGTFHTNFLKLSGAEKTKMLEIAKAVLFSETNRELVQHKVPAGKGGSIWQLLEALRSCEMKNDALLLTFYEAAGEQLAAGFPLAIYVFQGIYDVPVKASDKERLDESQEMYSYLIAAFCPLDAESEPLPPVGGLLYPAFSGRSEDRAHTNVFRKEGYLERLQDFLFPVR